ncbi:hypothetical protein C8T65DRAFT_664904 [Cerioporus squamosus]|nr:hypothetical protein C8T65DRAFT_664904 [Cerioporus squamosus]
MQDHALKLRERFERVREYHCSNACAPKKGVPPCDGSCGRSCTNTTYDRGLLSLFGSSMCSYVTVSHVVLAVPSP